MDRGTVFKITPGRELTTLHAFDGPELAPRWPVGGLALGLNGDLYGATLDYGTGKRGTVFRTSTSGGNYAEMHLPVRREKGTSGLDHASP